MAAADHSAKVRQQLVRPITQRPGDGNCATPRRAAKAAQSPSIRGAAAETPPGFLRTRRTSSLRRDPQAAMARLRASKRYNAVQQLRTLRDLVKPATTAHPGEDWRATASSAPRPSPFRPGPLVAVPSARASPPSNNGRRPALKTWSSRMPSAPCAAASRNAEQAELGGRAKRRHSQRIAAQTWPPTGHGESGRSCRSYRRDNPARTHRPMTSPRQSRAPEYRRSWSTSWAKERLAARRAEAPCRRTGSPPPPFSARGHRKTSMPEIRPVSP